MRLGVLFSGGKDSAYACQKAMETHEIVCLISLISENPESYMFHTPNIWLVGMQAEAAGLPIIIHQTAGEKEAELEDLKAAIEIAVSQFQIQGIVTGAIASAYQHSRISNICSELGLECINPLWQMDQVQLLRELVAEGYEVIISGVFAEPFTEDWLGRTIDAGMVEELKGLAELHDINPSGEGGEIETTVLDAPYFKKLIELLKADKQYIRDSGTLNVKEAVLVDK